MRLTKKNISLIIFVISLILYYLPQLLSQTTHTPGQSPQGGAKQDVAGTQTSPTPTSLTPPTSQISPTPSLTGQLETAVVTKIVDGDTIKLSNGKTLRYIGIDTPESVDPRRPHQCFGKEASEYNKSLVLGHTVRLEKDMSNTDSFGRILRYVYLENGTMVNEKLVRDGYAFARSYPPDVKHQDMFSTAEDDARNNVRGIWSGCSINNDRTNNL